MRLAFLVLDLDDMGGTSRAVVNLANELVARHTVRILSVRRTADSPHVAVDPRLEVDYLVDSRHETRRCLTRDLPDAEATRLDALGSVLLPAEWEWQFTALTDLVLGDALPRVEDDVLITVLPGFLALAAQLLPPEVGLVHQEHRASFSRRGPMAPLLAFAPRADLVAMLGSDAVTWLQQQLGSACPETVVMPNLLPRGYRPRSRLAGDAGGGLIVAAGRLDGEKQFEHLVRAFGQVADELPGWRVRVFGIGGRRNEIMGLARRGELHDRVELPGGSRDMPAEWARADVAVCSAFREGLPLVAQEAMAAGVPVVAYDAPLAVREIVEDGENGLLVPPDSEVGLATAVLRLAREGELRRRLGARALETVRRYDPDTVVADWEQRLQRVIARRRRGLGPLGRLLEGDTPQAPRPVDDAPAGVVLADRSPAAARRENLERVAAVAAASSRAWFVLPAAFPHPPVLVLPQARRRAFLDALAAADLPSWLSVADPGDGWWFPRRGSAAELVAQVRHGATQRLLVEPWPTQEGRRTLLADGAGLEVQFWAEGPDGRWHAPRGNPFTRTVREEDLTTTATLEGLTLPSLPLLPDRPTDEPAFPVDAVYTWVDGTDPAWTRRRDDRLAALDDAWSPESAASSRHVPHDELRYSLRSLETFAPWIRRIFLVTDGQRPDWLVDHPRLTVVDHREILPPEALPTFNSHAIETGLHRVPGLAEHFLYLNDDFFLGRPVGPEAFFSPAGHPLVVAARQQPVGLPPPSAPPWLRSAVRNRALLREELGEELLATLAHVPYAHRRSILTEIEERFGGPLAETAHRVLRDGRDVSLLSSFAQHYGLMTGQALPGDLAFAFVDITRPQLPRELAALLAGRDVDAFCLGDHDGESLQPTRVDRELRGFMRAYVPLAAPWEDPASLP